MMSVVVGWVCNDRFPKYSILSSAAHMRSPGKLNRGQLLTEDKKRAKRYVLMNVWMDRNEEGREEQGMEEVVVPRFRSGPGPGQVKVVKRS